MPYILAKESRFDRRLTQSVCVCELASRTDTRASAAQIRVKVVNILFFILFSPGTESFWDGSGESLARSSCVQSKKQACLLAEYRDVIRTRYRAILIRWYPDDG